MGWADEKASELYADCGLYDEISELAVAAALREAHIAGLKEALEVVAADADLTYEEIERAIRARISELEKGEE